MRPPLPALCGEIRVEIGRIALREAASHVMQIVVVREDDQRIAMLQPVRPVVPNSCQSTLLDYRIAITDTSFYFAATTMTAIKLRFSIPIEYTDLKSKSAFFGAREHGTVMRDLDALLNSLVNIDRDNLVAILSSEAEAAERLANSIRTRTSTQRLKRQQAVELAAPDQPDFAFCPA